MKLYLVSIVGLLSSVAFAAQEPDQLIPHSRGLQKIECKLLDKWPEHNNQAHAVASLAAAVQAPQAQPKQQPVVYGQLHYDTCAVDADGNIIKKY